MGGIANPTQRTDTDQVQDTESGPSREAKDQVYRIKNPRIKVQDYKSWTAGNQFQPDPSGWLDYMGGIANPSQRPDTDQHRDTESRRSREAKDHVNRIKNFGIKVQDYKSWTAGVDYFKVELKPYTIKKHTTNLCIDLKNLKYKFGRPVKFQVNQISILKNHWIITNYLETDSTGTAPLNPLLKLAQSSNIKRHRTRVMIKASALIVSRNFRLLFINK